MIRKLRDVRELTTLALLAIEIAFFTWYLWPEGGRSHPFLNAGNALLVLKYSSIYGIAAIGAAMVIISGGIDLAPGAVIALTGVVEALFVGSHWSLAARAGDVAAGVVRLWPGCVVQRPLPPFIAALGVMVARGAAFIMLRAE